MIMIYDQLFTRKEEKNFPWNLYRVQTRVTIIEMIYGVNRIHHSPEDIHFPEYSIQRIAVCHADYSFFFLASPFPPGNAPHIYIQLDSSPQFLHQHLPREANPPHSHRRKLHILPFSGFSSPTDLTPLSILSNSRESDSNSIPNARHGTGQGESGQENLLRRRRRRSSRRRPRRHESQILPEHIARRRRAAVLPQLPPVDVPGPVRFLVRLLLLVRLRPPRARRPGGLPLRPRLLLLRQHARAALRSSRPDLAQRRRLALLPLPVEVRPQVRPPQVPLLRPPLPRQRHRQARIHHEAR
ncbi:unnamed protein product [Linum tenue]|uniref:Uncharacterized protein n=1 Tax=Linum tenue TaxID=586396 RepID=A0AAV0LQ62_9ROSI|nr:unnamed protein product [Linum tenue]